MKNHQGNHASTVVPFALLFWMVGVIVASASGWLGSLSPFSPPFIASLTLLVPSLFYFLSPSLRAYFAAIELRRLTAVHILRIVAVPLFFWYGARNLLPESFVRAAGWGDLAAGLLALTAVFFWTGRAGYWTAHILGMVDFITAFAIASRLTNANPTAMHAVTGLPMALIPFFGVGVLATIHVIAYDLMIRNPGLEPGGESLPHPVEAL